MNERSDVGSVGAWMSAPPLTVRPGALARDAFSSLRQAGVRQLLVVEGGRLVGIVTDRDLRRPDLRDGTEGWNDVYRLDADYLVQDVMTSAPLTVGPHDSLETALRRLLSGKFGALPVVDEAGAPLAILTTTDLLRAFHATLVGAEQLPAKGL